LKKYVVLSDFIDKKTKKLHEKGTSYEATEERAVELVEKGFLEKPKKPEKEKPKDESIKA
jgi:hypothetical protein